MISISIKTKTGVILIAGLALFSSTILLGALLMFYPVFKGNDEIALFEKRFSELKSILPPQSIIGYASDENSEACKVDTLKTFYLTQYVLAPVIVVKSKQELLIGNSCQETTDIEKSKNADLVVIKDFGNGLKLFRSLGR